MTEPVSRASSARPDDFDVSAYLRRLRIGGFPAPDRAALDRLIQAHKQWISYENLDTFLYKRPAPLDLSAVYGKVILRRRGGYCFELNLLFAALLRSLGFQAFSCGCKLGSQEGHVNHCGVIVQLDGQSYFCDVGLGSRAPSGAILLRDGNAQIFGACEAVVTQRDCFWWEYSRSDGRACYICTLPLTERDFIPINYYMAMETETFRDHIRLNRTLPDGFLSLLDRTLTVWRGGEKTVSSIAPGALPGVIQSEFDIVLESGLRSALTAALSCGRTLRDAPGAGISQ